MAGVTIPPWTGRAHEDRRSWLAALPGGGRVRRPVRTVGEADSYVLVCPVLRPDGSAAVLKLQFPEVDAPWRRPPCVPGAAWCGAARARPAAVGAADGAVPAGTPLSTQPPDAPCVFIDVMPRLWRPDRAVRRGRGASRWAGTCRSLARRGPAVRAEERRRYRVASSVPASGEPILLNQDLQSPCCWPGPWLVIDKPCWVSGSWRSPRWDYGLGHGGGRCGTGWTALRSWAWTGTGRAGQWGTRWCGRSG